MHDATVIYAQHREATADSYALVSLCTLSPAYPHTVEKTSVIVSASLVNTWFALQRQLIPGLQTAYVELNGASVRPGGLVVTYPDNLPNANELALAARLAQRSGAPVTGMGKPLDDGAVMLRIAYPLKLGKHADGAVVVEVRAPNERQALILQLLDWGEAWLNFALSQRDWTPSTGVYAPLITEAMGQRNYHDALTVVLALLPERTGCTRVAVGRLTKSGVHLQAVSEQGELDSRRPRVKLLEAAMQEALLSGGAMHWPDSGADSGAMACQRELVDGTGLGGICSVPVTQGMRTPLVFCFEFAEGFGDVLTITSACQEGASIVAPLLELQRELKQAWRIRLIALIAEGWRQMLQAQGRLGRITALLGVFSLLMFALSSGEYRVSAPAGLEGAVQRAIVAPFDGYIVEALSRAGHEVTKGDLLARLDDRELSGELRKLKAEQGEIFGEHRQAVAILDHGNAGILQAQLEQVNARHSLVQDQLTRTELRAPFTGLVISGDWSRSLGVPISRGELLFQIAPLNEYQVVIQVSDHDIAGLEEGQSGELTLSAMPSEVVRFTVSGISSMAQDDAEEPTFRVEAKLSETLTGLRPGMQGIAKVTIGERRRWWIWTHSLTDWLRLQLWRLLP